MMADRPAPAVLATLTDAARQAVAGAYAPYSHFRVGAALLLADGQIVTGANVENASYGLSLCAETVAVAKALASGVRSGLQAVAIAASDAAGPAERPVTPCGRCRQVLTELAQLGPVDPLVVCVGREEVVETRLSTLLPHAFGPANLTQTDNSEG